MGAAVEAFGMSLNGARRVRFCVSGPLAAASRRVFDWTGLVERI